MNTDPKPHSFLSGATPVPPDVRQEPLPVSPRAGGGPIAEALGLAVRQLLALQVPRVRGLMDGRDLEGRADLLTEIAKIVDPLIFAIGSEGAEHSHEIVRGDWASVLTDALEDRALLSQFTSGADEKRAEEDDACEPQGSARARDAMGGV